jgi:hypothetical protein
MAALAEKLQVKTGQRLVILQAPQGYVEKLSAELAGVETLAPALMTAAVQPMGWQPVRLAAIDETWSAMRFRPADRVGK